MILTKPIRYLQLGITLLWEKEFAFLPIYSKDHPATTPIVLCCVSQGTRINVFQYGRSEAISISRMLTADHFPWDALPVIQTIPAMDHTDHRKRLRHSADFWHQYQHRPAGEKAPPFIKSLQNRHHTLKDKKQGLEAKGRVGHHRPASLDRVKTLPVKWFDLADPMPADTVGSEDVT